MKIKKTINTRIHFLFLPFLLLSFISSRPDTKNCQKETPQMHSQAKEEFLYVEGYGDGNTAEIRLNDIPIGKLTSGGKFEMIHKHASLHVLSGINTVSVYPDSKEGKIWVRFVKYAERDWADGKGGETLLLIETNNNNEPVHKQIELKNNTPHWSWLDADIISDPESHKEAIAFAKSFYKSLEKVENIDEIVTAFDPIYKDLSAIDPEIKVAIRTKELREGLLKSSKKEIWQFDDIDTLSFTATSVGNGRLCDLRRADGSPLIRTSQNSKWERITYRNIIGRKNGVWQFYR
ncbi:hypothetical protein [uncultured Aquimarina sp.]|uniref:hypothetical protein n=1 Tax=uncultured Aquimarina sp. TaxID=575652 RepID=UPI00260B0540|nr:hypothetical protein [uncultured Aquimarina sp.]